MGFTNEQRARMALHQMQTVQRRVQLISNREMTSKEWVSILAELYDCDLLPDYVRFDQLQDYESVIREVYLAAKIRVTLAV